MPGCGEDKRMFLFWVEPLSKKPEKVPLWFRRTVERQMEEAFVSAYRMLFMLKQCSGVFTSTQPGEGKSYCWKYAVSLPMGKKVVIVGLISQAGAEYALICPTHGRYYQLSADPEHTTIF